MNNILSQALKTLKTILLSILAVAMLWIGWFIVISIYMAPLTLLGKAQTFSNQAAPMLAFLTAAACFFKIYTKQAARFLRQEALMSSLALSLIAILSQFASGMLALGAACAAFLLTTLTASDVISAIVCSAAWSLSIIYYWTLVTPWLRRTVAPLTDEAKLRLNF